MADQENSIKLVKEIVSTEKKILGEMVKLSNSLDKSDDEDEKKMISSQMVSLKKLFSEKNSEAIKKLNSVYISKPLVKSSAPVSSKKTPVQKEETSNHEEKHRKRRKFEKLGGDLKLKGIEKDTIKRLKKKEKVVVKKKESKASTYVRFANNTFSKISSKLLDKGTFKSLERELIKANLPFTANTYVSMIFFTTMVSLFASIFIATFFLFFNFGVELPIITKTTESILTRLAKTFWIPIFFPIVTFFMMYIYPSLEKKSTEAKIDFELPFATINMSAISGSLIDPSKIFQIIITTKEYPYLSKEFARVINEINIQGYNFVSALRNAAFNTPSKKLSELFSGLATTINSGGDLPDFFEERSKSLLFEHRLEREKQSKTAETFMDIYISVVIAAPMILMLLLMMMRISGLGLSFSTATITLIMVLGVTVINIIFLTFLHLKKTD